MVPMLLIYIVEVDPSALKHGAEGLLWCILLIVILTHCL